jgi:tetratricopeptide (TPR) repeat protein
MAAADTDLAEPAFTATARAVAAALASPAPAAGKPPGEVARQAAPEPAAPPPGPAARPPATTPAAAQLPLGELMQRAQVLAGAGRHAEVAAAYGEWVAQHADSPLWLVACFNWGTSLAAAGDEAGAERAYRQALERSPHFAPALLNLGHLHERRGEMDAALDCWQRVHGSAAGDIAIEHRLHALNNGARLLENLKRLPEAEALMRASLELDAAQRLEHAVGERRGPRPAAGEREHQQVVAVAAILLAVLEAVAGVLDRPLERRIDGARRASRQREQYA